MSFVKIWIHLVFSTKNREPLLRKEIRADVVQHIIDNCAEKEIYVDSINGHNEHIHTLISLGKDQSISKISQLIKGESSFWINRNKLTRGRFAWQDDYFAVSIAESQLNKVRQYIHNQETHHAKKSFSQEVDEFMNKYGWAQFKD